LSSDTRILRVVYYSLFHNNNSICLCHALCNAGSLWVLDMITKYRKCVAIVPAMMLGTFLSVSVHANERASLADPNFIYVAEREQFLQARKALAAGSTKSFESMYDSLDHYPLQPYLQYERLTKQWRASKPGADAITVLNRFTSENDQTSLSRKLTRTLQQRFADTDQWETFLSMSDLQLAAEMPCTTLEARHALGQVKGFDDQSLSLWTQAKKQPSNCAEVLSHLETISTVPVSRIWEKIYNAMEADKPKFALPVLNYLATSDRSLVKRWIEAVKNPEDFLKSGALSADTVLNRRIVADLVVEWSKEDTTAAMNHWLAVRDDYLFYKDRFYDTSRAIAMRSAYRRMPEAYGWLYTFVAKSDDLELQEWRIRTALLAEDWKSVRASIAELPAVEQDEDHWAYWEARALEILGKPLEAKQIYTKLAGLQSYHGFLSADRLKQTYAIYDEPLIVERALLNRLAANPELVRAREFNFVGLPHESRREWNNWLSNGNPDDLAAGLARRSKKELYLSVSQCFIDLKLPKLPKKIELILLGYLASCGERALTFGISNPELVPSA